MAVTIELTNGITATINGYQWSSSVPALAQFLNEDLPIRGPSGADADPDFVEAQRACKQWGGKVIRHDPVSIPDEIPEGVVF